MNTNYLRNSVIAAALALGCTATAFADDRADKATVVSTNSVVLHYDRNANDGDREALVSRIETAARGLCGPRDIKSFEARRLWKRCYETAVADAMRQLDQPRLASLDD
ncbi:MAG: UrcA family protein [Gammaproteobacteria bacterium]|nr:UrcA family protein [Gammaproteobacteria bacterium]